MWLNSSKDEIVRKYIFLQNILEARQSTFCYHPAFYYQISYLNSGIKQKETVFGYF